MPYYPDEWHKNHVHGPKFFDNCAICGEWKLKQSMYSIYLRPPNSESSQKRLTLICERCLPSLLDFLAVPMP